MLTVDESMILFFVKAWLSSILWMKLHLFKILYFTLGLLIEHRITGYGREEIRRIMELQN